jgi:hypothetical protein
MIRAVMLDSGPLGRLAHADYSRNQAAQAIRLGATIATDKVGHLGQFVDARTWALIKPS